MKFDRSIFIGKFTQEAKELIQKLNEGLIRLEKDPQQQDSIKELLRASHTLKGSSKILGFNAVSRLSHKMEDLLTGLQDEQLSLTSELVDLLFKTTDLIGQCIEEILQGAEAIDISDACRVLDRAAAGEDISEEADLLELPAFSPGFPSRSDHVVQVSPADYKISQETQETETTTSRPDDIPHQDRDNSPSQLEETIRVGVEQLDNVVRLIGEIAVSHRKSNHSLTLLKELQRIGRAHVKQLQHVLQGGSSAELRHTTKSDLLQESHQLLKGLEKLFKEYRNEFAMQDLVIGELYEDILNMRMLPLSTIFKAFPRAVRDMSKYFHKNIELRITGDDTTLDKKIIEKLDGPLIHILRNSIDHGIEAPDERLAKGKPTTGLIEIRASCKSGHIKIEIRDDGRGVQLETLKQRAIQRGLISEEKAGTLSDAELLNLVFLPRLSTSEMITDISGRGVGMDVVKVNIEQLKGSITLKSSPDRGSSCILTLPMTLTTLRSLIISSRQKLFAVPINTIEETLQVSEHEFIDIIGHNAIRRRNQIIYVVELADILDLEKERLPGTEQKFVLIARINGTRVGLIVDKIIDEQDVVVKQLPPHMQKAKMIAGAAISSSNSIMLILHIPEILDLVKHATQHLQKMSFSKGAKGPSRILVVDDSVNTGEIEKRILEAYGYQVDLALDGLNALEQLEKKRYDLIVTDVEMPGMDGFSLTEHLRNMPQYAAIPIVIVTSLERESDRKRGLQVGANAYITKGHFEQRSLIEVVRSLV